MKIKIGTGKPVVVFQPLTQINDRCINQAVSLQGVPLTLQF